MTDLNFSLQDLCRELRHSIPSEGLHCFLDLSFANLFSIYFLDDLDFRALGNNDLSTTSQYRVRSL